MQHTQLLSSEGQGLFPRGQNDRSVKLANDIREQPVWRMHRTTYHGRVVTLRISEALVKVAVRRPLFGLLEVLYNLYSQMPGWCLKFETIVPFHILRNSLLTSHSVIWCCMVFGTDSVVKQTVSKLISKSHVSGVAFPFPPYFMALCFFF
jgi:hypothetical protein